MKNSTNRTNSIIKVGIGLLALFLVNIGGTFFFTRLDLTSEKRHTLTGETIKMVQNLNDRVFIRVYLEGDFPADFKRLRNAVKERLDELKAYGGEKIEYEFINPSENPDKNLRQQVWRKLVESGLEPTEITVEGKDALERKLIFPGAIISYRGKELPIQILRSHDAAPSPEILNSSINNLEYNIANSIRRLTDRRSPKIGILAGHGELSNLELEDFVKAASDLYSVERVRIDSQLNALLGINCLVIAKPDSAFNEKDKFIIDQFIMRGGRVLWCLEGIDASMDSLRGNDKMQTLGLSKSVNLEDQLFTYGVRVRPELLIDRSCAPIALNVGKFGDKPNLQMFPWYFNPVIVPGGNHPINLNVDPIYTEFLSGIDTVGFPFIQKTILLHSSAYTRIMRAPVRINLGIVGINPNFGKNSAGPQPVAVLLEGRFKSAFANRISSQIATSKAINFKTESARPTKMIVIGDGDIIKNKTNKEKGIFYPLGYDNYQNRKIYGNREFLLNALNFLMDDSGMIAVRSREIKLRKLDGEKLIAGRTRWQIINIGGPIFLVMLLGLSIYYVRKRKYA